MAKGSAFALEGALSSAVKLINSGRQYSFAAAKLDKDFLFFADPVAAAKKIANAMPAKAVMLAKGTMQYEAIENAMFIQSIGKVHPTFEKLFIKEIRTKFAGELKFDETADDDADNAEAVVQDAGDGDDGVREIDPMFGDEHKPDKKPHVIWQGDLSKMMSGHAVHPDVKLGPAPVVLVVPLGIIRALDAYGDLVAQQKMVDAAQKLSMAAAADMAAITQKLKKVDDYAEKMNMSSEAAREKVYNEVVQGGVRKAVADLQAKLNALPAAVLAESTGIEKTVKFYKTKGAAKVAIPLAGLGGGVAGVAVGSATLNPPAIALGIVAVWRSSAGLFQAGRDLSRDTAQTGKAIHDIAKDLQKEFSLFDANNSEVAAAAINTLIGGDAVSNISRLEDLVTQLVAKVERQKIAQQKASLGADRILTDIDDFEERIEGPDFAALMADAKLRKSVDGYREKMRASLDKKLKMVVKSGEKVAAVEADVGVLQTKTAEFKALLTSDAKKIAAKAIPILAEVVLAGGNLIVNGVGAAKAFGEAAEAASSGLQLAKEVEAVASAAGPGIIDAAAAGKSVKDAV